MCESHCSPSSCLLTSLHVIHIVAIVKLENFYRELTPESHTLAEQGEYNFDHPDSIDFRLLESMLVELASGRSFPLPSWDFKTHKRLDCDAVSHSRSLPLPLF
jgi:uridine kinase